MLTNVVERLLPFHCTTEVSTKFDPYTIRVNPAEPAAVIAGDRDAIVGTGIDFTETAGEIPELASPTVSLGGDRLVAQGVEGHCECAHTLRQSRIGGELRGGIRGRNVNRAGISRDHGTRRIEGLDREGEWSARRDWSWREA